MTSLSSPSKGTARNKITVGHEPPPRLEGILPPHTTPNVYI